MTEDIERLLDYGRMGLETGQYEQAREDFEKVLALDPSNREAMKGLARVNETLSRKEAAAVKPIQHKPVKPPRKVAATNKAVRCLAAVLMLAVVVTLVWMAYIMFIEPPREAPVAPTATAMRTETPKPKPPIATPIPPTSRPPTPNPKLSVDGIVRKVLGRSDRGVAKVKDVKVRRDGLVVVEWAIDNYGSNSGLCLAGSSAARDIANVAEALSAVGFCQGLVMSGSFPVTDVYGNTDEVTVISVELEAATLARINWEVFSYPNIYEVADELYLHPALLPCL